MRKQVVIARFCAVSLLLLSGSAWAEVCTCHLSCTYFEPPTGPDDVFRLATLDVPIKVRCDSSGLVSDALERGNGLEGCILKDCEPAASIPMSFGGLEISNNCDESAIGTNPSVATIALRFCARKSIEEQTDLVARLESCFPRLIIRVENRSRTDAGASTTRVEVPAATVPIPHDIVTPSIPAGGFVLLDAGVLPSFCQTGCSIKTMVDYKSEIEESGEENNGASTLCRRN